MASPAYPYMAVPAGPQPIPTVRDALEALAADMLSGRIHSSVAGAKLKELAGSLRRKPPISVAPRRIRPLSYQAKILVRAWHRNNPDMSQLELANKFNTNPGRISEALNEIN